MILRKLYHHIKRFIDKKINHIKVIGKSKVFGIGLNKTGTTSLKAAMDELGYIVGDQREGEKLIENWAVRDFDPIIKLSKSAQFFQDVPFSKPYTFVILDHEFPNSKFILTVRDSAEQWYKSLTEFHAKKWGKNNRIPNKEDLMNAVYRYKGSPWFSNRVTYDTPEDQPYKKDILIDFYTEYNRSVKEYFKHRPDDLLVLNVAEENSYQKLCDFLDVESDRNQFPWKNKTKEVNQ